MLNNYKIITCVLLCFILSSVAKGQIVKICAQEDNTKYNEEIVDAPILSHSQSRTIEQLVDYPMGLLFLPKDGKGLFDEKYFEIVQSLIKKNTGFKYKKNNYDNSLGLTLWDGYDAEVANYQKKYTIATEMELPVSSEKVKKIPIFDISMDFKKNGNGWSYCFFYINLYIIWNLLKKLQMLVLHS